MIITYHKKFIMLTPESKKERQPEQDIFYLDDYSIIEPLSELAWSCTYHYHGKSDELGFIKAIYSDDENRMHASIGDYSRETVDEGCYMAEEALIYFLENDISFTMSIINESHDEYRRMSYRGNIINGSIRLYCGRTRTEFKVFNDCMTKEYDKKIIRDKDIDSMYSNYYVDLCAYDFIEISGFLLDYVYENEIKIYAGKNYKFYADLTMIDKVETNFNGVKQTIETKTLRENLDYKERIVQYAIDNDISLTLKLC